MAAVRSHRCKVVTDIRRFSGLEFIIAHFHTVLVTRSHPLLDFAVRVVTGGEVMHESHTESLPHLRQGFFHVNSGRRRMRQLARANFIASGDFRAGVGGVRARERESSLRRIYNECLGRMSNGRKCVRVRLVYSPSVRQNKKSNRNRAQQFKANHRQLRSVNIPRQ